MNLFRLTDECVMQVERFCLAKYATLEDGVRQDHETQDQNSICERGGNVLAVISDGVTHALRGGMAARIAVDFVEKQFRDGAAEARTLLAAVYEHLWELNQGYMESEATETLFYQCMIALVVIDKNGDFEWASLGDSVIQVGKKAGVDRLTAKAEFTAERLRQRAGMPLEYLQLFSGDSHVEKNNSIRLFTDGFNEWHEQCAGKAVTQIKRMLQSASLNDDVSMIELKRV